jgi:20S proteasome alpha/beta subunit
MSCDTQETTGDYKMSVEKLAVIEFGNHHLVVGGAGIADFCDSFVQMLRDNSEECVGSDALRRMIQRKLTDFYTTDIEKVAKHHQRLKLLIAARALDGSMEPALWVTVGRRVRNVSDYMGIGIDEPLYRHIAQQLYRQDLPLGQLVFLALLTLSVAKDTSAYVGGESRVAVVTRYAIDLEEPEYVAKLELRLTEIQKRVNEFLLACPDTGISPGEFSGKLRALQEELLVFRHSYLTEAAEAVAARIGKPDWQGDAYPKFPLGVFIRLKVDGTVDYKEAEEYRTSLRKSIAEAEEDIQKIRGKTPPSDEKKR